MNTSGQQTTITLSELHSLDQHQSDQPAFDHFACYMSVNSQLNSHQMEEVMALDSQTIPKIPIRRVGCSDCLRNNHRCQRCPKCIRRGVVCCRSVTCIYELGKYLANKEATIYKKCKCTQRYQVSTQQFAIDWRLFSLLSKVNNINKIAHSYYLHLEAGILWIAEYTLDKQGRPLNIARNFFEENFHPHPELITKYELQEHNTRNFSNLVKQRVRTYITYKNDWDISNIEQSCREVVDQLMANRRLQQLKYKLQQQDKYSQNAYVSGAPLRSNFNLICSPRSQIQVFKADSPHLSRAINDNLLFFYHPQRSILFAKNAKYQEFQQQANIKAYPLIKNTQLNNAVWFKDRKGDIFAIHGANVSIFKYHQISKKFQQIIIKNDEHLHNAKHAESLVYIAQFDRVYYFNSQDIATSFYFDLYRIQKQEGQFSNCVSANAIHSISLQSKIKRFDSFFRVVYLLQQKNSPSSKKNPIPVIYLLGYKKNYHPLPLCLLRVTDVQKRNVEVEEVLPKQSESSNKVENVDFESGVHTIFKKNKREIIAFMSRINGRFVLAQGTIFRQQRQALVDWNFHILSVFAPNICKISTSAAQRQAQKRQMPFGRFVFAKEEEEGESLCLSDLNGFQTNNTTRYLSFLSKSHRCVEMILSLNKGKYSLNLFNTY